MATPLLTGPRGRLFVAAVACMLLPLGLNGQGPSCPGLATAAAGDDLDYRCRLLRDLERRGLDTQSTIGAKILTELSRTYSNVVEIAGAVPLAKSVLDYLLRELPDTASLVNRYNGTNYHAAFLDLSRSRVFATNNRNMQAEIIYLDSALTATSSDHLLFESGRAKWLFWKFSGNTVLELRFDSSDQSEQPAMYRLRIHIFTDSRGFHLFFGSALFRGLLRSMLNRVLDDVVHAVQQFADSGKVVEAENPGFATALRRRLQ